MAFDSVAADYDKAFGVAPTGRLFRFRLAERVMASIGPSSRILDVGCGTGEDALWLAAQGHTVHGVDASPRMIERAKAKAERLGARATFECRDLTTLVPEGPGYDVLISNFGVLNCVPLAAWAERLPRLLRSRGRGFVVLMGNRPLPGSLRSGGRGRRDRRSSVLVGGEPLEVHYESVPAIREALSRAAAVSRVEAFGCLVPSPSAADYTRAHPVAVGLLAMGECLVRTAPWFRGRGDHTLFEFTVR